MAALDDEFALHLALQRADQAFRQCRVGAARLRSRDRAGENADADQERLLAADDARPVERFLVVGGGVDLGVDDTRQCVGYREGCRRSLGPGRRRARGDGGS